MLFSSLINLIVTVYRTDKGGSSSNNYTSKHGSEEQKGLLIHRDLSKIQRSNSETNNKYLGMI